jgi:hypothetical protein
LIGYLRIAGRWVEALIDAYTGRLDVPEALAGAAADIETLVAA